MFMDMVALYNRYTFLRGGSIGKSVLGTDIPFLRFGRGPKQIIYNASHHANEYITTPILMRFIEVLCESVLGCKEIGGADALSLYNEISLYAVPMVNPDGVDLVTGQLCSDSEAYRYAHSIRGNRVDFPSGWKANINGVDLNNNYPALFEEGVRLKEELGLNEPGPRDFPGPHALSEPESAAMARFTRALSSVLTVSLHTQGREIYYRFNEIIPPDGLRIGRIMSEVSGYVLADPPGPSFGGYKDWYILEHNRPGYTVEIGLGINPLPIEEFPELYAEAEPILVTGILEAPAVSN